MLYRKSGDTFVIRLMKGEEVIKRLTDFSAKNNISLASFSGIGAVKKAEIGFYDLKNKKYLWEKIDKEMEVLSIIGNVSVLDKKPFIHAHITLGDRSYNAKGGHLKEAVVGATLEIVLTKVKGKVERKFDDETGLNLLDL